VFTLAELGSAAAAAVDASARLKKSDAKRNLDADIGRAALRFTNEFRASQGLPPLQWHQALSDVGFSHCQDMAHGRVPFSHQGFAERVARFPFPHRFAAENLAMNRGVPHEAVARVAVDGWIDSPGHRRNLLANATLCGISVYCGPDGAYYLTQLFARAA
jgi:uncharacterized protein YkwD